MNRSAWLGMIMERKLHRFDNVYPPGYDAGWGAIGRIHASFVSRVVESAPRHGCILDAACGTGRFFPTVLEADRQVVGVDWSEGMLARAAAKFRRWRLTLSVCWSFPTMEYSTVSSAWTHSKTFHQRTG
jgi:SAM-dependent methyltransferase